MSSKSFDKKKHTNVSHQDHDITDEKKLDFSKLTIPFSKVSAKNRIEYIYLGHEKIPFSIRHPVYQIIFRNEFAAGINKRNNRMKIGGGSTRSSVSF